MKKGFTILELLVASLLLGMLVTVLTSIFNQSSIAWRTGTAGVADLDDVRDNMAEIREEADNAFVHKGEVYSLTGLWDENGNLRKRACDVASGDQRRAQIVRNQLDVSGKKTPPAWKEGQNVVSVGSAKSSRASRETYTINVKSNGPNGKANDFDDIWSYPDEFDL